MHLSQKASLAGWITRLTYIGLLAFYSVRLLILAPASSNNPWVIWLIYFLPLLGFAPAVLTGKPRPHAWLCFMLLLYFTGAVLTAIQPTLAIYGWIESLLICVLFISAMMFARWQSQYLRSKHNG